MWGMERIQHSQSFFSTSPPKLDQWSSVELKTLDKPVFSIKIRVSEGDILGFIIICSEFFVVAFALLRVRTFKDRNTLDFCHDFLSSVAQFNWLILRFFLQSTNNPSMDLLSLLWSLKERSQEVNGWVDVVTTLTDTSTDHLSTYLRQMALGREIRRIAIGFTFIDCRSSLNSNVTSS